MSQPPTFNSTIFSSDAFAQTYLTRQIADTVYVPLTFFSGITYGTASPNKCLITDASNNIGGINALSCTSLTVNGSPLPDLSILSGLTAGTVTASKLVLVDANRDITNFRNIGLTAAITSSGSSNSSPLSLTNTSTSSTFLVSIDSSSGDQTIGSTTSHKTHIRANGNRKITITTSGLVGINNTAPARQLDIVGDTSGANNALYQCTDGTVIYQQYYDGTQCTLQTYNNYPLTFATNNSLPLMSINTDGTVSVTNTLSATLSTAAQPNITSTGNLTIPASISVTNGTTPLTLRNTALNTGFDCQIQSTATGNVDCKLISPLSNTLMSLYANGKRQLTVNSSSDIVNIVNHNGSSTGLSLNGTLITSTATKLNYTDISTLGTCVASKCVTTDASLNVTALNNISNTGSITTTINNNTTSLVTYQQWINSLASPMTVQMLMSNIAPKFGTLNAYDFRLMTNNITALWISQSNQFVSVGTGVASYKLEVQTGDCNLTSGVYRIAGTDISTAISGITAGTASASKALIVDSSRNITNINSLTTTGLTLGATAITATGAEINYNAGITLGLASASKVLSCDSSLNVTGVNKFLISNTGSTAWANNSVQSSYGLCVNASVGTSIDALGSALAFACDSAVNTVPGAAIHCNKFSSTGTDMSIALRNGANLRDAIKIQNTGNLIVNSTSATLGAGGWITTASDGSSFPDGSYCRHLVCRNNSVDVISFQIEILEGSGLTTTNGTFIGNITQNDLKFGVNNSTKMTISSASSTSGFIGIGTSSPVVPLDVSTSGTSRTFDVGGLGYGQLSKTTTTFSIGPVTTNITAQFSNSVLLSTGSYYTISDQRIKKNFTEIKDTTSFIRNVNPCLFEYRNDSGQKYLGYKAQDVAKESIELINFIDNPNMKIEGEGDIEGVQLSVDYTKVCCLLHKAMQVLLDRVDELEALVKK